MVHSGNEKNKKGIEKERTLIQNPKSPKVRIWESFGERQIKFQELDGKRQCLQRSQVYKAIIMGKKKMPGSKKNSF